MVSVSIILTPQDVCTRRFGQLTSQLNYQVQMYKIHYSRNHKCYTKLLPGVASGTTSTSPVACVLSVASDAAVAAFGFLPRHFRRVAPLWTSCMLAPLNLANNAESAPLAHALVWGSVPSICRHAWVPLLCRWFQTSHGIGLPRINNFRLDINTCTD